MVWCFFVMLRLQHDEDGVGFRFVTCDLDPTAAAAEKASLTEQPELRSSRVFAAPAGCHLGIYVAV